MKLLVLLAVISLAACESCWKGSYGRGVGKPISTCRDPLEKSGLLCYPKCRDGYKGVGPVCWGTFPKSYGRGFGKVLDCKSDEVYDAGLCYKDCRDNYSGVGPVCWG